MSASSPRKRRETAKFNAKTFGVHVDGRSRAAMAMRRFHADLVAHVGGNPSVAQRALITSLCQVRLRLLALDQSFATKGHMTETESKHYRGWTQTFHSGLRELGLEAAPPPKQRWQPYDAPGSTRAERQAAALAKAPETVL
jgi:hypothetical protein